MKQKAKKPKPVLAKSLQPNERVYTAVNANLMVLKAYLLGLKNGRLTDLTDANNINGRFELLEKRVYVLEHRHG